MLQEKAIYFTKEFTGLSFLHDNENRIIYFMGYQVRQREQKYILWYLLSMHISLSRHIS
jgi:hypothetical protein